MFVHGLICNLNVVYSETVGVKLLRRLGWRPGQGVGPRVTRQQKRLARKEKKRMYGHQGHIKGGWWRDFY